ncbi:MAG TPA: D-aminoacyl-tRNA deacylase [Flexilinea sp.]|nr:D-aminoacyl-tRNA deacylase [Flexilinea sp.]
MKAVIQRVSRASVTVDGRLISRIGTGLLVLLGVEEGDTQEKAVMMAKKTAALRIFRDENDKMNLSVRDCAGEAIVVSQFTLCADTRKGNRPSFIGAAAPEIAAPLVDLFAEEMREQGVPTQQGIFGADMKVELLNDGPVTILLEN